MADQRPNIILIITDQQRFDTIRALGFPYVDTPNLDRLVNEGVTFTNAFITAPSCAPSRASLFTGLYPAAHGCTQENWTLSEDVVTLAEVLRSNGYQTHGITENPTIAALAGFGQGFDSYQEIWRPREYGDENPACNLLEGVLASLDRESPLFLFINFIEPHAPYNSSREFIGTYVDDPESGPNGNHGQVFEAIESEDCSGNYPGSYYFDGVDDYISIGNKPKSFPEHHEFRRTTRN